MAGVVRTAVGATTSIASAGVAGAASNPAAAQALQQVSMTPTDYAVDRLLAPATGAGPAAGPGAAAGRADIAAPIARTFAANSRNPQLITADRTYLASLVARAPACRRPMPKSASTTLSPS